MRAAEAAAAAASSKRSRGERLAFWGRAKVSAFSARSPVFFCFESLFLSGHGEEQRKMIGEKNLHNTSETFELPSFSPLSRALSLSLSSPAAMSPRALSTSAVSSSSARAAAPIARGAARVPAPPRRRGVLVRAEESKSELTGVEKAINAVTSFLNNSPLAQGTSSLSAGNWRRRESGNYGQLRATEQSLI